MLVTETTSFQGSKVRFPVKALRFFSEFFQLEKSTLDTGCFKAGFSPEFPFSGIPLKGNSGFSLALQAWANAKQWLGLNRKVSIR